MGGSLEQGTDAVIVNAEPVGLANGLSVGYEFGGRPAFVTRAAGPPGVSYRSGAQGKRGGLGRG